MVVYDAVMPGYARWADDLTIQEKFLLMEINASRGEFGFSKARNCYLCQRCGGIQERCLQIWLKDLEAKGYIDIKFVKNKRRIYVQGKVHKKEFTQIELSMMRFKSEMEIVNKIKKRFTLQYPCWETSSNINAILQTLANFYFEPEVYTLTLADEPVTFELLETLIEILSLDRLTALKNKLKEDLDDIEYVNSYVMTAIISNHSKELRKFRDIQKRFPKLSFDETLALYREKANQE